MSLIQPLTDEEQHALWKASDTAYLEGDDKLTLPGHLIRRIKATIDKLKKENA